MLRFPLDAELVAKHERIGDPLVDPIADLIIEKKPPMHDLMSFVETEAASGNVKCRTFLAEVQEVPVWVNFAAMQPGAELFLRNSLLATAVFVLHSLVLTYVPVNQARVLVHTGRLRGQVLRRLYETATLVRDVLEADALKPGAPGWRSVLRVRILHALVRRSILAGGRWQHEIQPINQTELAQTGTLFGYVVADGIEKLGVPVSAEEKESYHHLWRYANWLQGVPDALQVAYYADEERLHHELGAKFYFPDANSFTLIESLFDALDMQAPFFMPKPLLKAFTANLMQPVVAERISLTVEPMSLRAVQLLQSALPAAGMRYQLVPFLRGIELTIGRAYFHNLIAQGLGGVEADFKRQGAA